MGLVARVRTIVPVMPVLVQRNACAAAVYIQELGERVRHPKFQPAGEAPVQGSEQPVVVRGETVGIICDAVVTGVGPEEIVGKRRSRGGVDVLKLRTVGNRVDAVALLQVPPQHAGVGNTEQRATAEILLHAERHVVVALRFSVLLESVGVAWRQHARRLQEGADGSVVLDGSENCRWILAGGAPDADAGSIQDGASTADGGLAVSKYVISETETRPPVCGLLIDEPTGIGRITRHHSAIARVPGIGDKRSNIALGQRSEER